MISEETRAYYDLKKRNDVRESAKRIRRQFLRYKDAEIIYSLQHKKILELASAAGAIYRMDGTVFAVLKLKERYPDIRLILVLPCFSQTRGWSQEEIEIYDDIKQKADKVVYTSQEYTRGCMHKRNRHLVDNSSACISYLTENKGGTFYTVNYAKSKGVEVINIAE